MKSILAVTMAIVGAMTSTAGQTVEEPIRVNPLRDAYYGDLHVHTSYSLDAYVWGGTKVDPDEAYRFARGEVVMYLGRPVRRREPLDFLAVTDHSENIGVLNELEKPESLISKSSIGQALKKVFQSSVRSDGERPFDLLSPIVLMDEVGQANPLPDNLRDEAVSAWQREVAYANVNYKPGSFTTFIGYEWTSMGEGLTFTGLHRNVIFKGNTAPQPFTSFDSKNPEDLWAWLKDIRAQGYEALAIPHNGNGSGGRMYDWVESSGKLIDKAYAEERQANEPLSEISQTKGQSETHPSLSPRDELSSFELLGPVGSSGGGSFLRDALSRGLVLQQKLGVNPFKYGFVGGSDLHGGLSVSVQADFAGDGFRIHTSATSPTQEEAAATLNGTDDYQRYVRMYTSGSLTGVWCESNTRESIYDALRRKETFATSGTKLRFRFFGAWTFPIKLLARDDWIATAYTKGVPMGGDLPAKPARSAAPRFAVWAMKDPNSANLDRVQIVKVWEDKGQQKERVFDVAWAGRRNRINPVTGKLAPIGNTVNLETGAYANTIGATELKALWQDPEFNARRPAAYYLRVLEIPTPRWSTLLAIEHGLSLPKDLPATEQQRGWSSPIWYTPTPDAGRQ